MNVITTPRPWQSVFRDACFVLGGVNAPGGLDVEICCVGTAEPLGTKRLYADGEASVNVAPYLRRRFSVEPMCGAGAGLNEAAGRVVSCYVEAPGLSSAALPLTCGTVDAEMYSALSAAGESATIRPGERDEISLVAGAVIIIPSVEFTHGSVGHSHNLYLPSSAPDGMMSMVVDVDEILSMLGAATGIAPSEIDGFTVELKSGAPALDFVVRRRYTIDRNSKRGRRLAWVNRFGAVDYYTFPAVRENRVSGSRTRILAPGGYRTVATAAELSETLLSEPCDERTAQWLAEVFSSPAVWKIEGGSFERVEVEGGEVSSSPLQPAVVSVGISPATKTPSRKL